MGISRKIEMARTGTEIETVTKIEIGVTEIKTEREEVDHAPGIAKGEGEL